MLITARWLLTGATPPLQDAAVLVEGETIRDIGTRAWFAKRDISDIHDLGDSILIPGLVNSHCHLELSALKGILPPGIGYTAWVKMLTGEMLGLTPQEKKAGIEEGVRDLLRGGTTTLVDHRSAATKSIETPFREEIFWEVLGASEERARASLGESLQRPTPHSLYAVHEEVLC